MFGGAEIVGYVASALVVLSLTMRSVVRLRIVSLVGSIVFVVYGVLIDSIPIVITNGAIAVINVWFLRQELGLRRDLGAIVVPIESPFVQDFIAFHLADIRRFQPGSTIPERDGFCLLLNRDGLPAGALIGRRQGGELEITLDYVLQPYRDSRLGRWLFGRGSRVFRDAGIHRLTTAPGHAAHRRYLETTGFRRDGDRYVLDLDA
jgi:hypothetical protein